MPSQKEEQQAPKEKNETIKDGEQKEEQENRNELDSDTDSDETDSDSDLEEIDLDSYVQSYLESEKKPEEEEEEEANDFYITEGEEETDPLVRPGDERPNDDNTRETNIRRFTRLLNSKRIRKSNERKDAQFDFEEDKFDFPEDPEKWTEEDLKELWADAPTKMTKPGWDPVWADDEDWKVVREEVKWGRDPLIAPFYVPYRKPYPAIPDNNYDVSNPKAVIEELDRIEEFLTWVSYIFADGSSYEGTVWDDLAHGKGVYIAEQGLVRYEGEWLQNDMDGHGVVEVDIPDIEPVPGSELEAEMRAEGKIISRDFMSPEDKKWLEMDIEDSLQIAGEIYEIPFYENDEWVKQFGKKPEKGRYRYAGQWKLGRMHGCGVYEVNERTIYGRFYFGELVEDSEGCDEDTSALHAGLAEVAAAKARMFVNKPDGMVREERGPYSDPQHPYFYEEEDVWMAPGFINQFYEVPDYWKTYVHEIDQEREMWLNSFYKSPFRIPMPAELEYWWEKDEPPEYVLVNKEPVPDPEDPSKLIYTEDPLILHTPTGRLINYTEDEEHGVRLFWQPPLKEGEEVDLKKVEFLPLGFDEFYGRQAVEVKDTIWMRLVKGVENKLKPLLDKVEKWTEAKKKASEKRMELYEKEMELIEAELCLEEAIEEMDEELKMIEKEEEKKTQMGLEEEDTSALSSQDEKAAAKVDKEKDKLEVEEEEDEEEEDDNTPSSFGSVYTDENPTDNDQKGKRPGDSPFSSSSLLFASCSLVSSVPSRLRQSFFSWKPARLPLKPATPCVEIPKADLVGVDSVSFPVVLSQRKSLRARVQAHQNFQTRNHSNGRISQLHSLPRILYRPLTSFSTKRVTKLARAHRQSWQLATPECHFDNILSLHTPVSCLESYIDTIGIKPHCDLL